VCSSDLASTAEKGERIFEMLVEALTPVLLELSQAERGQFPFVIREGAIRTNKR